jgi:hypothetical protein
MTSLLTGVEGLELAFEAADAGGEPGCHGGVLTGVGICGADDRG